MKKPTLYSMIRHSDEDQRDTLLETLACVSLLLSVIVSIAFATVQPVVVPGDVVNKTAVTEQHA